MSTEIKEQSYWKSLNELSQNDEYKKFLHREFPENATELSDGHSRRHFLKIMGASIALAGLAACRKPVQKILPYTKRPEDVLPGIPNYYATAMPLMGSVTGLLVQSHEGRPTKVEGNPDHPNSLGGTSTHHQASILGLYDPDRSRSVRNNNTRKSWNEFVTFAKENLTSDKRIAVLSEASSSPTLQRLKNEGGKNFSSFDWLTYEPFGDANVAEGNRIAFGSKAKTVPHYDKADLIVSVGDDFLSNPEMGVRNAKGFSKKRRLTSSKDDMSTIFVLEQNYSVTGSTADHRMAIKQVDYAAFIFALAAELSKSVSGLKAFSGYSNRFSQNSRTGSIAAELLKSKGSSIVTADYQAAPSVHAAVAAINTALGNNGKTVNYHAADAYPATVQELKSFTDRVKNGEYDVLIVLGGNPEYNLPNGISFDDLNSSVETSLHLSDYVDETSRKATWHVNRASYLEAWGDGKTVDGTPSVIQPLIRPLFQGKSDVEFLSTIIKGEEPNGYKEVQDTWKTVFRSNFQNSWEKVLHDGISETSGYNTINTRLSSRFSTTLSNSLRSAAADSAGQLEVVIKNDLKILDGRFANNGWLQELPDPVTKITWDNVALMSAQTAIGLGIPTDNEDDNVPTITISNQGNKITIPAWVLPGHADESITLTTGYGRRDVGVVASSHEYDDMESVGFDVMPLTSTEFGFYVPDATVNTTGNTYKVACTQDHHSMEGRALVRYASKEQYELNPGFAPNMVPIPGTSPGNDKDTPDLFTPQDYPDYEPQWGMTIDLNACIGCGVCAVACQAENNIPVIGKREVSRGREMSWIRVDRYFVGDQDAPKMVHQPVPCMHCEKAPCEQVCPVAATTHSDDGLNQMTYNRCIGTRYCANNCPYKVRRFNFFNYQKEYLAKGSDPEIVQMAMNPDVSIRFRGVMEKCTYCVQRINRAKIETKNATGNSVKPKDGAVVTACQQACPTDAIYFGDISDPNSEVSKTKANERNYSMLAELNTQPRTSYMAKIMNTSEELA
jgi:molybdopterin-containing oxidoreductase family iron-sulfur binding subunit